MQRSTLGFKAGKLQPPCLGSNRSGTVYGTFIARACWPADGAFVALCNVYSILLQSRIRCGLNAEASRRGVSSAATIYYNT